MASFTMTLARPCILPMDRANEQLQSEEMQKKIQQQAQAAWTWYIIITVVIVYLVGKNFRNYTNGYIEAEKQA